MSLNFCFIGAGNLATHLSEVLVKNGFNILQVFSKTEKSAQLLAQKVNSSYTFSVKEIDKTADIYIVALKDDVVENVLSQIEFQNKLLIHCAGSLPLSVLGKFSTNIGVLYPLQTFSKNRAMNFENIPLFVEANSKNNEDKILAIAKKISKHVEVMNSEKRQVLHVSAVFACNFTNYLYTVTADILESNNIPFEVIRPLIFETAEKVMTMHPNKAQTGPAIRFDENIISKHVTFLNNNKAYKELYMSLSKGIFESHKKL